MWKSNRLLRFCGRIMLIVILMSFLKYPVSGEEPTTQSPTLSESETKRYSDSEIDCLIDDISEIAIEAIEQAAAEAAKAAALAAVEREAEAMREAARWQREAETNLKEITLARKAGKKNTVIAALIGIFGGLAIGISGTLIIGGR